MVESLMHPYILEWPWKRLLWLNNRENREVTAVNCITLHTTHYISVYIGWSTFDAVDFGAYRYMHACFFDNYMYKHLVLVIFSHGLFFGSTMLQKLNLALYVQYSYIISLLQFLSGKEVKCRVMAYCNLYIHAYMNCLE